MEENKTEKDNELIKILSDGAQVILLRHGESIANQIYNEVIGSKDYDPEIIVKNDFDKKYVDVGLSDKGIKQCEEVQYIANNLKIHTVFTSPLRRALDTTYNIHYIKNSIKIASYSVFKNHPDFDKIKFIVLPEMRESLNIASDFPENIYEIEAKYKELIPQLDFSEIDKLEDKFHHYLSNIDKSISESIYSKLERTEEPLWSNAFELMMEEARPVHPGNYESRWNIHDRTIRIKEFVKKYIEENKILADEKIILSAHFVFFVHYTGSHDHEYSRDELLPKPDHYISLKNCQFLNDPSDTSTL